MPLPTTAAYGMYSRDVVLPEVVRTLNRAGVENQDICMVLSAAHPLATIVRDARLVSAGREESAVSAGVIGWVSEFGAVVIPSVGFFMRSQAFFHALVIEQDFGGLCGGSRTLAGLGFSDQEARRLGQKLNDAGVLVYVACPESATAEWVSELLRCAGAPEAASLERTNKGAAVAASAGDSKDQSRVPLAKPLPYPPREIPSLAFAAAHSGEAS